MLKEMEERNDANLDHASVHHNGQQAAPAPSLPTTDKARASPPPGAMPTGPGQSRRMVGVVGDLDSDDATSDTAELIPDPDQVSPSCIPLEQAKHLLALGHIPIEQARHLLGQLGTMVGAKTDFDTSSVSPPRMASASASGLGAGNESSGSIQGGLGSPPLKNRHVVVPVSGSEEGLDRPRRVSRFCRSCHCFVLILFLLIVLATVCGCMYFIIEPLIKREFEKNLVLKSSVRQWSHPSEKPVFHMYMFNITNVEEVLEGKPMKMQQLGPYVYRLKVERTDVTWNENSTVSYRDKANFEFAPELTNGSMDDIVTTVNLPLAGLLATAGRLMTKMMSLNADEIFITRTVDEMLWGFESDVLKKIGSLGSWDILHLIPDVHNVSPVFSYLKDQNGTAGSLNNVYTGADDFLKFNKFYSWDHKTRLNYWATMEANELRGSDGSMFHPFMTEKDNITVFQGQLYRTFDLQYQKTVEHSGVKSFRYIIPDSEFSSSVLRGKPDDTPEDMDIVYDEDINASPENEEDIEDFFDSSSSSEDKDVKSTEGPDEYEEISEDDTITGGYCSPKCLLHGVYSLAKASRGVPMIVSLPHFLGAHPAYSEHIEGLEPNEEEHRPHFDVDQVTGVTLLTKRRHQINIRLDDSRLAAKYVPLFWNDISVELTEETMSDIILASTVMKGVAIGRKVLLGFAVLCCFIVAIAPAIYCRRQRRCSDKIILNSGKGYVLV